MYAIRYTVLSASIYGNSHRILEGKSTIIIYGIGNLTHHSSQLDIYSILWWLRAQILEPVWVLSVAPQLNSYGNLYKSSDLYTLTVPNSRFDY